MKFCCDVSALVEGLNVVTRALAVRPAKEIMEYVLLDASDRDEGLVLTCSDGNFTIQTSIDANITEEGKAALKGRLLSEVVRKLPLGEVTMNVGSNSIAQISCLSSKTRLLGKDAAEYPEMESGYTPDCVITVEESSLKIMINHVVFSIASDESRPILTGALLEVNETEAKMVALDGFRLAMHKIRMKVKPRANVESIRVTIPGRALREIRGILSDEDKECELHLTGGQLRVITGRTVISTVLLGGQFVDYMRIIPQQFKTEVLVNRNNLLQAIERTSLMAREGKNNLIHMRFSDGLVVITSNAEIGEAHEEFEINLIGDPVEIAFNSKYIGDVVHNVEDEKLRMCMSGSIYPCVVKPENGDDYTYLILPVRV